VPLDTEFPELRIQEIAEISGASDIVSTDPATIPERVKNQLLSHSFEGLTGPAPDKILKTPFKVPEDESLVLLFTSGSTGRPKGTVVTRKQMHHVSWRRGSACSLSPSDRYTLLYSSAFMGGAMAIHTPLLHGSTLCIFDLRKRGLAALPQWMRDERITVQHMITSILRRLMLFLEGDFQMPDLRLLVPGGERSRLSDLELWKTTCPDKVQYCTNLGSTETGTLAMHLLSKENPIPGGTLPVGEPFGSLGLKILRNDGSEASPMEEGELVVSSHYIFRGYLGDESLNQACSFNEDGSITYRTGDFGYIDNNGILHNAGRKDSRIKINGNLIELPEIESRIIQSGLVRDTCVVYRSIEPSDRKKQLVAFYIKADTEQDQTEMELTAYLLKRLPKVMIPHIWIPLTMFPQTGNGKTNVRKMREMDLVKPASRPSSG
jgi:acyl-coenzyme A synthetase/AMP-(fatty) acid ligase